MAHWEDFVQLCKPEFANCTFKEKLISSCNGKEDVAWVVYYCTLDNSLNWMNSMVPALGNKTPRKCLGAHIEKLKQVLLSFPC